MVIRTFTFITIVGLACALPAAGQDPWTEAKTLYAAADYERALDAFQRLPESREVLYYRAMCLVGLGRLDAAEQPLAALVMQDPLYVPNSSEMSPRVLASLSSTRTRLLPEIARNTFTEAKSLFDQRQADLAAEKFELTIKLLNDPVLAKRQDLADLRVVAEGFRDLVRADRGVAAKALAATPVPAREPEPDSSAAGSSAAPLPVLFSPPVAIQQTLPPWRPSPGLARQVLHGEVHVNIDESGHVTDVRMTKSVHVTYDPLVMTAAKEWTYKPATRNGVAIPSDMTVPIQVRPAP
jgi:TonB family protein